jgi:hypothetical protein
MSKLAKDMKHIRSIACRLVEGQVLAGKLNPDDPVALKAAVIKAGIDAKAVYAAALEFVSG